MNEKQTKKENSRQRFVPLTRKEPLSQRTVLELFSGSKSTQLVKVSTPARVEVETSAKKLFSAWTSLLLEEKPQANQEATVSAAYCRLKSRILLKYPVRSLRIHKCLRTLVARLSGVEEKIMKEIRSGSSEKGCGRSRRV